MRIHNFNAGPATLPKEVLDEIHDELLSWRQQGYSMLEMGHRSDEFRGILDETQKDLKELLNVPHHYKLLFLAGGATVQFAMIPMHLLKAGHTADYFQTGVWSEKAIQEAKKYGNVHIVASSADADYRHIPEEEEWSFSNDASYCHYTQNETVHGVEFHEVPNVPDVPLICDMTSCILSEPVNVSQFGLIYAGAQKNLGIAGLSLVIIRDDLLERNHHQIPSALHYLSQAQQDSLVNTPPTFAIYVMGLVAKWVKNQGGLAEIAAVNQRKSDKLYQIIDSGEFYHNPVKAHYRSTMNPIFFLPTTELEPLFLQEAQDNDLYNLQGHRSVGGMRASLYNAVSEHSVDVLVEFMKDFAKRHG
jgi:phosphoserine aminotransferase